MEAQEVFDTVAVHLLTQGRRSMLESDGLPTCGYRGCHGMRCAVGCLIPDDRYFPEMERNLVHEVIREFQNCGLEFRHLDLYNNLQVIHDHIDPRNWRERLLETADEFSLSPNAVLNFKKPEKSNEQNHNETAPSNPTNPAV